jgi:hypothetical protein
MNQVIECAGNLTQAKAGPTNVPGVLSCDTGWLIKPATDFQGLIDLLSFKPEICGQIIGVCLVIFVIGYSSAKVVRILTRR